MRRKNIKKFMLVLFRIAVIVIIILANLWIYSYTTNLQGYLFQNGIELKGLAKVANLSMASVAGLIIYLILSKISRK